MLRKTLRVLKWTGIVLLSAIGAFLLFVQLRWDRTLEAPLPEFQASTDSAAIARGRYLAMGPAHCASCHVGESGVAAFKRGELPPLVGGRAIRIPPGTWYPANLTPDSATGIGTWSDAEVARALRHGVRRDGRWLLPMMNFKNLSDADVVAILSFLRSQPPVRQVVPPREVNLIGRAVSALLGEPVQPESPLARPPADIGVARGEYIANNVADCAGCHTARSHATGQFTGPRFAGGSVFPDEMDATHARTYVSPNLTPAGGAGAGPIATWTEEQFVARFRTGRVLPGSPMHWESFSRMSEEDLRSLYRYFRSLAPKAMPQTASR